MINELISLARGVLTFDDATFAAHLASRDALKRGLLLMVIVALLAGLFPFFSAVASSFRRVELNALESQVERQIEQSLQFNPVWQNPEFQRTFREYFQMGFAIVKDISQLKPNVSFLPSWLDRLLRAFGEWLSLPFAWLGAWAWYALWVALFAKLLGGRATLERMLAATSLFVVPHVLDLVGGLLSLFNNVAVAGACFGLLNTVIGLAAWAWGVAIYVKATAAANEFGLGKATLATLLPALLAALLALLLVLVAVIGIVVAASGSR
jgi:hypothetical protein